MIVELTQDHPDKSELDLKGHESIADSYNPARKYASIIFLRSLLIFLEANLKDQVGFGSKDFVC